MEFLVGIGLAVAVTVFAVITGFERDRAFYPTVMVVVASYYELFSAMAGGQALGAETFVFAMFVAAAVVGFRRNLWIVVAALAAHGCFDLVHGQLIPNPGVPAWWPGFCMTFDVVAAACLIWRLKLARQNTRTGVRVISSQRAVMLLPLVLAIGLGGCASLPKDAHTATVDGHKIVYRVLGSGEPVVVMISGLGEGMATFSSVAPEIARSSTVILYDRAGYGGSDATPDVRDAEAAARELDGLLRQTGIAGPYVLAGHSLGGLYAEYYASRHPDQVAALILEEARPADFDRRCEAAGITGCSPTVAMMMLAPAGAKAEIVSLADTAREVEASPPASGKATLVISRTGAPDGQPFARLWSEAQVDLAARYSSAVHMIAPAAGHVVHHDQPDWFVSTVTQFLKTRAQFARPMVANVSAANRDLAPRRGPHAGVSISSPVQFCLSRNFPFRRIETEWV